MTDLIEKSVPALRWLGFEPQTTVAGWIWLTRGLTIIPEASNAEALCVIREALLSALSSPPKEPQ